MRRRSLLVACTTAIGLLAGCASSGDSTGTTPTPTPTPGGQTTRSETAHSTDSTPRPETSATPHTKTATPTGRDGTDGPVAFIERVNQTVDGDVSFSKHERTWTVEYSASVVVGEPFTRQQERIAKRFAATRPEGVTLDATVYHECTTVHWSVSAELARRYDRGAIGTDEFRTRVRNTTRRENNC